MSKTPEAPSYHDALADTFYMDAILNPSTIASIWSKSKSKQAMLERLQWFFRPRNSYEQERVDYNCLNIFAEFQTYNLQFAKNELYLSDRQCANVLDLFWRLLEFDPDSQATDQSLEINIRDQEEDLLRSKVDLMKSLLPNLLEHTDADSRITAE